MFCLSLSRKNSKQTSLSASSIQNNAKPALFKSDQEFVKQRSKKKKANLMKYELEKMISKFGIADAMYLRKHFNDWINDDSEDDGDDENIITDPDYFIKKLAFCIIHYHIDIDDDYIFKINKYF